MTFTNCSNPADTVFEGRYNPLHKVMQLQPAVRCSFDLLLFPWDVQTCTFNISISNINGQSVIFTPSSVVAYRGNQVLEEYIVEDVSLILHLRSRDNTVRLVFRRRSQQFLWSTYLPTTLLLAIGYGTLYLPAEPFSDRGTMSLTTLLVLVALYADSLTNLPDTSYITHINTWFIFSMVYLTLIISTHLYTSDTTVRRLSPLQPSCRKGWVKVHRRCWTLRQFPGSSHASRVLWHSRVIFAVAFCVFVPAYVWPVLVQ